MTEVLNKTEKIYADPQISQTQKNFVLTDIARSLFFLRIAQLQMVVLGRAQQLHPDLKIISQKLSDNIRSFDQKMRGLVPPEIGKHLTLELGKDKVYDISNLVELSSKVTGPAYEVLMTMMTDFFEQLPKSKINYKKYTALVRFLINELKAEDGGETSVVYDAVNDTVTFKLSSPKSRNNAIK